MQMSKWEMMKMRTPWKQKLPESDRIRRTPRAERNKNMKIQDMLSSGFGVRLVSKVEVSGRGNIDRSFRLRFSNTGKRRDVSNSDLSR